MSRFVAPIRSIVSCMSDGPQLNAATNLSGQFVETFGPKDAGSALVRGRKRRCHGEMEARLQGDRLIYDFKVAIELFELAAHKERRRSTGMSLVTSSAPRN